MLAEVGSDWQHSGKVSKGKDARGLEMIWGKVDDRVGLGKGK